MKIFKRNCLLLIEPYLFTQDILLLYGARQVGKTSIMKYLAEQESRPTVFFDLENSTYLDLINGNLDDFIRYLQIYHNWRENDDVVIFIDEIQYANNPTSFLKYIHDHFPTIKLIVSGSSTLEIRGKMHDSLAGRLLTITVYPLDFTEFLLFQGKEYLIEQRGKSDLLSITHQELQRLFKEYCVFGGYPKIVLADTIDKKKVYLRQIFDSYIQKDVADIGHIRNVSGFNRLLLLLASQAGNLCNTSEISNTLDISVVTLKEWLLILENTFVIHTLTPFYGNIRSELTKMPKLFFVDAGIRNYLLGQYEIDGATFEQGFFCFLHHTPTTSSLQFWRTQNKQEIDFIVNDRPIECKLSYSGERLTALHYFNEKYGHQGTVVTMKKPSTGVHSSLYPWEVVIKA